MNNFQEKVAFIWSIAELLRGDYKQSEYADVILPLTVLRRLDCVLEKSKAQVLEKYERFKNKLENLTPLLTHVSGYNFYNISPFCRSNRKDRRAGGGALTWTFPKKPLKPP
ncbi:MAG: type I restriction-modification system subunit M N-terminal domain-containing protein, partial [Armatimonadetes bacterium]|nr:type I restriction-modification system subunit M N-terminal domain-containing protein [Armatimonadota bacterium]